METIKIYISLQKHMFFKLYSWEWKKKIVYLNNLFLNNYISGIYYCVCNIVKLLRNLNLLLLNDY